MKTLPAVPPRRLPSLQEESASPARRKETRREKFLRLLEGRGQAAAKSIEIVGYLGSRERYQYTDEDARVLDGFLREAVDKAMAAFGVVPRVQPQAPDADALLETMRVALETELQAAEAEIRVETERVFGAIRERLVHLQQKAIEEVEQAALTIAGVDRDAAEAAAGVLAENEEAVRKLREAALSRARERVMAALRGNVAAAISPAKKQGDVAALLYGPDG